MLLGLVYCFFLPCFLLFVFRFSFLFFSLHPGMFIFFVSLCLCSSHLLLSANTYFMVRVLSAWAICTLPHLGILLFFHLSSIFFFVPVALISQVAFFLLCSRTRYASTWFAYLDSLAMFGFPLSHCLWPQNLYLYDEESGRTLEVLLMLLFRKNGRFNEHQQYPQSPFWFFMLERYKLCGRIQWDREKPNVAKESR